MAVASLCTSRSREMVAGTVQRLRLPGFVTLSFNTCQHYGFLVKPDLEAVILYIIMHRGWFQIKQGLHI